MAKILLVEDDNNLREIYEARLQAEGYDIVSAKDGEEALVVAKKEQPDLIIADVMMPRVSGFEMLDILRNTQELKDVHVIMLTALGQAEDKTRADSLGADRYLVKSQVTLEDIVKTAADVLAGAPAGVSLPATAPVADPVTAATDAGAPQTATTPTDSTAAIPVAEPPAVPAPTPAEPAATIPVTPAPPVLDTTDQTAQSSAAAPQPAAPTAPVATPPQDTPTAPEPSTSDTQLVADAVKSLVAETDKNDAANEIKDATPEFEPATTPAEPPQDTPTDDTTATAPAAPTPATPTDAPAQAPSTSSPALTMEPVITPPAVPAPTPAEPVAAIPATAPADGTAADNGSEDDISVTGRKTIQPLPSGNTPKPAGLDELLAREGHTMDNMDAPQHPLGHSEPPHPPGHVISPGGAAPAGPSNPASDPNSISL